MVASPSGRYGTDYRSQFDIERQNHRLSNWTTNLGINESYSYDKLGNLTSKAGATYTYNAGAGLGGPYALDSTSDGKTFLYGLNGNVTQDGSVSNALTWDYENLLATATVNGVSETYAYDGDGERVKRTVGGLVTYYIGGVLEEDSTGAKRTMYTFDGQVIAQREVIVSPASDTLIYLHSDHLGSVSATSSAAGTLLNSQNLNPTGKVRSCG